MKAIKIILGFIDAMVMPIAIIVGTPMLIAILGMSALWLFDNPFSVVFLWTPILLLALPIFFWRRFIRKLSD